MRNITRKTSSRISLTVADLEEIINMFNMHSGTQLTSYAKIVQHYNQLVSGNIVPNNSISKKALDHLIPTTPVINQSIENTAIITKEANDQFMANLMKVQEQVNKENQAKGIQIESLLGKNINPITDEDL